MFKKHGMFFNACYLDKFSDTYHFVVFSSNRGKCNQFTAHSTPHPNPLPRRGNTIHIYPYPQGGDVMS